MIPPLLGNIMSIDDAGSSATASTNIFDENMTWSRSTIAGSTSFSTISEDISRSYKETREEREGTETITRLADFAVGWTDWNGTERIEESRREGQKNKSVETSNDPTKEIGEQPRGGYPLGCTCEREDSLISSVSDRSTFEIFTAGSSLGIDLVFDVTSDTMEDIAISFSNDSIFNESVDYIVDASNKSCDNDTSRVLSDTMYPSGYTLSHIILASIVATLLMVVIVVGNMLVIIAIMTEKALKNIQNWFIASLAVADFFLGLIIMPFSLANEIMGYWIFGYWWCDIYSAMDVLLCTASIMNLCLISLDRFWSITQAVDYLKKRTPARAALMIALVWLLSALVCIPPLLGWKRPTPEEDYPKCKVSNVFFNHSKPEDGNL